MKWGQTGFIILVFAIWIGGCNQAGQVDRTARTDNRDQPGIPKMDKPDGGGSGEVLATVGGRQITSDDLDKKLEEIPTYARANFETKDGKMKLLDRLVQNELLVLAADDAGYADRPDIRVKLQDARERILTSEFFKNEISQGSSVDENEIRKYYEAHKDEYKTEESAEARHILLDTEADAKSIREKLINGSIAFEKAAQEYSKDIETKDSGGDLGTVRKGGFIKGIGRSKEFDDVVFSLKTGEISPPISSRKGYHIVKVDAVQPAGYKDLEDVRQQISEELMISDEDIRKEYAEHPDDYKNRARVKIRHIQIETEEDARNIEKELKAGTGFDELVEKRSLDAVSVKQKGNLGYLYKDGYIRGIGKDTEFEKAVFALKEGEISGPIKSQKGWHIVKVDEKTDEVLRPLDEVRSQIKSKLIRDVKDKGVEKRFDDLKKKYNVQVFEDRIQGSTTAPEVQS